MCTTGSKPPLAWQLVKLGISRKALATGIEASYGYTRDVANGRLRPSAEMRRRIAAFVGLPEGELFEGER